MFNNISNHSKQINAKTICSLFVLFAIAVFFWNTVYLYPIKIFVVILHEFSHGIAAILTGGHIDRIEVNSTLGGVCWTNGGNRAIVLSAGYLGSMLWGSIILLIASRTKHDNVLGIVIGCFLIILSLLFIRNLFGFIFAVGFGLLLIFLCCKTNN
ncbi:MAG: M50 family metallopeptidase, partial [Candidatus Omnitrophica bacterium]|nr:M50 family metallopeptidase [Candidatus Omnitrophota bacterium]MBU1995695.1 M50 family metallopeptidase [Candidatus Omnitrophota bacterium]